MSFSEYRERQAGVRTKAGDAYSTFYVPGIGLTTAQKEAAKKQAKLRREAYRDPVKKEAWKAATAEKRRATASARKGIPRGPNMDSTGGYFVAHAAMHGLEVSRQAIKAINVLLVGVRKDMVHRATELALRRGDVAVYAQHVADAIQTPPGMRTLTRQAPPLRVKKARAPRFSQLPLE